MRIIAGRLKGRRLVAPRGDVTRPTADQVRLALMDALMPYLPGARVLDLFAGAGGVGLEALSRGATHATFVERDARAVDALRRNVSALGVAESTRVMRADVARGLAALARAGERFDIVFADPPYEGGALGPALTALAEGGLAAPGAIVVAQHPTKHPPPAVGGLTAFRTRRFGETTLTSFRAGGYDRTTPAGPSDAQ